MRRLALAFLLLASCAPAGRAAGLDDGLTQQAADGRRFFDGAAAAKGSPDVAVGGGQAEDGTSGLSKSESAKRSPAALPVPTPSSSEPGEKGRRSLERLEDRLFKISWWLYHAAWAADTAMTGLGIAQGRGYEADRLYTHFGNRNVAGVVGSLVAVHIGVSALTLMLHRQAKKRHGWKHHLLEAAAIGINLSMTVAHVAGALSWTRL